MRKVGQSEKFKSIVMGGVKKLEKFETLEHRENSQTDEERKVQNEEKLCKLIIEGFARHNRERRDDTGDS